MENTDQQVKSYIQNLLEESLQDFNLIDGGQQRTVGDLVENKVSEIIFSHKSELISEVRRARSKKSIEDITVISNNKTYYIDPKTHDVDSDFSMPNLTSITKIKSLFNSDDKELLYVFVSYKVENNLITVKNIKVLFMWEIDSSILGIGALGKGQLQIKDMNKEIVLTSEGKTTWFKKLKEMVHIYLNKQVSKIEKQKKEWQ